MFCFCIALCYGTYGAVTLNVYGNTQLLPRYVRVFPSQSLLLMALAAVVILPEVHRVNIYSYQQEGCRY